MKKDIRKKFREVKKPLTDEERLRHAEIRRQVESEKDELIARGRQAMQRHERSP
jgi:hypothetical protein